MNALYKKFIVLLTDTLTSFKKQSPAPIPAPAPVPVPSPAPPAAKYLWDNFADARHSVRVICDEEGLLVADKNVMCACVQVESNFSPAAVHQNKGRNAAGEAVVLSTDYGIVQVNDYWHIGPGKDFPSVVYVLTNPEACVRWMAKLWKAGKQKMWCSYTSGAYKQYLDS